MLRSQTLLSHICNVKMSKDSRSKRIRRFLLLIHCLLLAPLRGRANKKPASLSKIIVVLTGKLGDIVCGTPVLFALRKHAPYAHIIVAGAAKLQRSVLAESGLVDEYLNFDDENVISLIKNTGADAAVVTGPSYFAVALLYIACIPLITAPRIVGGYSPSETRPYKILQKFVSTFPYAVGNYAPRERLRALEPLGIFSDDIKKHLAFSAEAKERVRQFLAKNDLDPKKDFIVALSPSAGNKIKEWPEEKFAQVGDWLIRKHNAKLFILGGPGDVEKVAQTMRHMNESSKALSVTDFSLDDLKAFVSQLHLFISVDTGPIYIAEAFDVPTVDITGPIDEKEQPPIGPRNKVVVPPGPRKPELFVLNARSYNYTEAKRQIDSIEPSLVIGVVDKLILDLRA